MHLSCHCTIFISSSCIPYSGYFSVGNIFVVFVVERQTTKYLPTKTASQSERHACVEHALAQNGCGFSTNRVTTKFFP